MFFGAERKKTELHQELSLQARDLRFQHQVNITPRNNKIIMRMEVRKTYEYTNVGLAAFNYLKNL